MSVILQISDPHFGTEQPPVTQALETLAHAERPDVVVLSGDITQRATRSQFRAARAFVDGLRAPAVLAIPGNHDIPLFALGARLLSPYARYREAFGNELAPVFESNDCLAIAVNTTRWYRHEDGEVSEVQVEAVAARLATASARQLRVVVVHQPLAVSLPEDRKNRLHGRERAVPRWAQAGADLVMSGHIHLPLVLPLHEHFDGCERPLWAVQAGTAVSSRLRGGAPNSVNVVRCADRRAGRCQVERWDFDARARRFAPAATHTLNLAPATADAPQPVGRHAG